MFIYDKPIETEKDDFLGRKRFSGLLGKALLDWKEKESLVIAVYGVWGSGKSSVINLAIESIRGSALENKPTIIEFNPWIFSEENNLGEQFFNEIAKELEIKKDTDKDKIIAKKLKFYASLLNLTPEKSSFAGISSKIILILGFFGVSSSQIISWLNIPVSWIKNILLFGGLFFLLVEAFKGYLTKFADYYDKKAEFYLKSVSEVKKEIKKDLLERQKKLIILIDDIDRLNQSEIRQIFRLIRVNADFPNTIYLLAFDRKIIEKNLEEQVGVSGKDYLDKIVQVSFDVPFAKPSKISAFLFKELDRILSGLPKSAQQYFGQENTYWANIYHSGFKDLFANIRDVKRYASGLEFNLSQMYQGETMEVNPIDFIAIEAIRVFTPNFYDYMKSQKDLFTSSRDELNSPHKGKDTRKIEIDNAIKDKVDDINRKNTEELVYRLFPQINTNYGYDPQSGWSKQLRVCATSNFDAYFTLIPGGDEDELSQHEIEGVLGKANSETEFEKAMREYVNNGKIRKVLQRIQDYTDEPTRITQEHAKNVVKALFNISDDLPEEKVGMWDIGADMDIMRIIYQLLKREPDKNKNYELLKTTIPSSMGIYGPVQKISLESSRKERDDNPDHFVIPEEKIGELQQLCLEKIKNTNADDLIKHRELLYILYRWKEWDKDEGWKGFVSDMTNDDTKLLLFMAKFISRTKSQTMGDYGIKMTQRFNYKSLGDFIDTVEVKKKLEGIKQQNNALYQTNKEVVDLFLDNYEGKNLAH